MTSLQPSLPSEPEVSILNLIGGSPVQSQSDAECSLLRVTLQEGMDVVLWRGQLREPMAMNIRDDWGRVNFTCSLKGNSSFALAGRSGDLILRQGAGCISYTHDCKGTSVHQGQFASVTVSVAPHLLADWLPDLDRVLQQKLDNDRFCDPCYCDAEMRATAQTLGHALERLQRPTAGSQPRSPLWLLGQSLVLISHAVEGHRRGEVPPDTLSLAEQQRLMTARDLLLSDLSQAPTIAELARATGLSVLKLKRGFRLLFSNSIYGLFQAERMHEARRRLSVTGVPVMVVAADLGYANASHFTAAFQKQFGVNPSAFKRGIS
ncbi:AraC family transcriptional regulator [Erwinia rhapontici]|uniref:AraC family transcriptional regulator n=1 Tax=Erwinia rhapontici TaxID=55212 RepID=A0ABM7N5H6_ERWRD|nr:MULTISPECIES: AraC family transcriptional regulator [Erwinia]NNS08052.1 helix-turn-helix transcriptional regulator [Erwinia sp. JH02]TDT00590.1 AraC family transcriptional regulator [Erwinia rhapontici]BCQ36663.1 AraC family transcriptional regulator [Erwinia rhapontici]BCQ41661.1 AraC family transcriptional regulator [Erwinia rhapontici]BCQ46972.1 AraC family transcriptional regulator [Erwinia rhapontici]